MLSLVRGGLCYWLELYSSVPCYSRLPGRQAGCGIQERGRLARSSQGRVAAQKEDGTLSDLIGFISLCSMGSQLGQVFSWGLSPVSLVMTNLLGDSQAVGYRRGQVIKFYFFILFTLLVLVKAYVSMFTSQYIIIEYFFLVCNRKI